MLCELQGGEGRRFCPQNWMPQQRRLMDRKNNFRSFIYGRRSSNRANFVKIGLVDVEIHVIGLTKIIKIFKETTAKQPSSPVLRAERAG